MADKITWLLNGDSSQVRSEMMRAMSGSKTMTDQMARDFGKVDGSYNNVTRSGGRLLESNNKVTNQFAGFTRTILTARSATDVLAASMDRLENSTNLSLGAGVLLAGGAVLITQVNDVIQKYDALRAEIKKVHDEASKGGEFQTLSQLEAAAVRAEASVKKLQDRIDARSGGGLGGLSQRTQDLIIGAWNAVTMPKGVGSQDSQDRGSVYADLEKNLQDRLSKRSRGTDMRQAALDGAPGYEAQAQKIQMESDERLGAAKALDEMAQIIRETTLAFKELAKTVNDKKMERAGMSLKELAATPSTTVASDGITYERWKAGEDARRALALEAQGEQARMNFDPTGANAAFNAAGEVKEGITNLKPSEKMAADLKGALAVSEQKLQEIATNTAKPLVNR